MIEQAARAAKKAGCIGCIRLGQALRAAIPRTWYRHDGVLYYGPRSKLRKHFDNNGVVNGTDGLCVLFSFGLEAEFQYEFERTWRSVHLPSGSAIIFGVRMQHALPKVFGNTSPLKELPNARVEVVCRQTMTTKA